MTITRTPSVRGPSSSPTWQRWRRRPRPRILPSPQPLGPVAGLGHGHPSFPDLLRPSSPHGTYPVGTSGRPSASGGPGGDPRARAPPSSRADRLECWRCMRLLRFEEIPDRPAFRQWARRHHPDKAPRHGAGLDPGDLDDASARFQRVSGCADLVLRDRCLGNRWDALSADVGGGLEAWWTVRAAVAAAAGAANGGGGAGGAWAVDAYPYLGRPLASRGAGPRGGGGRALVLVAPLPLPAPRWWPCRRGAVEKMLAGGATANTPAPAQAPAAAALTSSAGGFVRARRTLARPSELEVVLGSVASGTGSGPAAAAAAASAASATNDADSATRHWGIEMGSGPLAVDAGAIGAAWPLPAPPWLAPLLEKPPPGPADGPGRAPLVEPLSAVASAGPRVRFLPQTNGDVAGGLRWRMTPQISVGVRARLPAGFRVRVAADPSRLAEAWRGGSPLALARGLSIGVGLEVAAWDGRPPEAAASDAPAAGPSSPSRSSALGSWPAAWPALTPRGGPVTAVDSARAAGPARPPRARGGRGAPRGFSLLGRSIEWRGAPGDWRELAGRRGYWGVTVVGRAPGEADHRVAVPGSAVDGGGQRRFWDPADAASGAGGESAKKRSAGAGNAGGAREGLEWLAMSLAAALAGRGGGKGGGGGWGEGGAGAQPRSGGPTSPLDFVRGGGDGGGLFGRGGGGGGA